MGRNVEDANTYRIGHPLAQRVLERCIVLETPFRGTSLRLNKEWQTSLILEPHVGESGWLVCARFTVQSFEAEDRILFAGVRDDGDRSSRCLQAALRPVC